MRAPCAGPGGACARAASPRRSRRGASARRVLTSAKTSVAPVADDQVDLAVARAVVARHELETEPPEVHPARAARRGGPSSWRGSVWSSRPTLGAGWRRSAPRVSATPRRRIAVAASPSRARVDCAASARSGHACRGAPLRRFAWCAVATVGPSVAAVIARVTTFTIDGLDPQPVVVEADLRAGLPAFTIVGLADRAVSEARERVKAAILNAGFEFPQRRVTVNLAPAHLRKAGGGFDLAIACAILAAEAERSRGTRPRTAGGLRRALAERRGARLPGHARGRRGRAPARARGTRSSRSSARCEAGARRRCRRARHRAPRAAGRGPARRAAANRRRSRRPPRRWFRLPDLCDVRGHAAPIEALTVAAAGAHHLLLCRSAGQRQDDARAAAALDPAAARIRRGARGHADPQRSRRCTAAPASSSARPFRAPHHTTSAAGLVGGGRPPALGRRRWPTAASCSSTSWPSSTGRALESLRQPLEDGHVDDRA